jgi:hypothetical protein
MSDLSEARNSIAVEGESYVETGLLNTVASVSSSLYVFALLLYFIYICIGGNTILRRLLFISSFSQPIHILTFVGRDGIVFWVFTFIFLYSLFFNFMPQRDKERQQKVFLYTAFALGLPFMLISLSRFVNYGGTGTIGSIISYFGQGFINGPLLFGIENPPFYHGRAFPLFFEITGLPMPVSEGTIQIGDWRSWTFNTFVGGFYLNFGLNGLFLVAILLFVLFNFSIRKKTYWHLGNMIMYILYFTIYSQGVFYFRERTRGGNLFILLCFLISLWFALRKYKGTRLFKNNNI